MILPRHTFSNCTLHQPRQRWQYINRWINTTHFQLPININLSLSDIPSQVRYRMSNIVIGHTQYWNLGNTPNTTLYSTSTLIYRAQIRIHVARISSTSWNLLPSCTHFSQ